MPQIGQRLGHYLIEAKIGEGGMGQVFRAQDTRLDRAVALKVLPAELAEDAERRARFEQEARTVSQLKHPNICVLHDVGHDDGHDYLVMELIEGETLGERLRRAPMGTKDALSAAIEIAEALDAAHRQGVVHRDLKPGNVMLTRAGAKLLDFGLARVAQPDPVFGNMEESGSGVATHLTPLTSEGTLLGTVQYMAPEQLEGKPADSRTDMFAFGALLYEMLTGRPAFGGDSKASTVAAIMGSEPPPLSDGMAEVPPLVDRIVTACLAKDPEDRFQSAHDLARDLRWILQGADSDVGSTATPLPPTARPSTVAPLLAAATGGALVALAAAWLLWGSGSDVGQAASGVVRAVLPLGEPVVQGRGRRPPLAVSPDGTLVAYVAPSGNTTRLKIRRLDSFDTVELPNTERAQGPFFSPDSQWVGYFADAALYRVPVAGGMPTQIVAGSDVRGAVWLPDDTIVYTPTFFDGLFRVPAGGGTPVQLTEPDRARAEKSHRWPAYVPEHELILFTVGNTQISSFDEAPIGVLDLRTGETKILLEGGSAPGYLSSGHFIYGRNGALFATPFDAAALSLSGTPSLVLEGVSTSPTYGTAAYSVSRDGSLAYVPGSGLLGNGILAWVDRNGEISALTSERRDYLNVRISPNGRYLALEQGGANDAIWTYDLERDVMTRLTFVGDITGAVWSPQGDGLVYTVPQPLEVDADDRDTPGAPNSVYWVPADGSGNQRLLARSEFTRTPTSWSGDGRHLLLQEGHPDSTDLWLLTFEEDGEVGAVEPYLASRFNERSGVFSPDGRWVAYSSDESGRDEIQVRSFPDGARKVQLSRDGGVQPRWRADGRELFFRNGDQMLAVPIDAGDGIRAGAPTVLFDRLMQTATYDVSADGQRFLMVQADEVASPSRIEIVLDWQSELSRRIPR